MSTVYVITRPDFSEKDGAAALLSRKLCGFWIEDGKLMEIRIDRSGQSLLGNIYVGKVKNVVRNIESTFVEIAGGQVCFLPFSEISCPVLTNRQYDGTLKPGDELLVQVKKDAAKTKDPLLTANLTLNGRYFALTISGKGGLRCSHNLSEERRAFVREALGGLRIPESMTLVARTISGTVSDSGRLLKDAQSILERGEQLLRAGKTRTVFSLLSGQQPGYLKRLTDFNTSFPDKIVTDDPDVHTIVQSWMREERPNDEPSLAFYADRNLPLSRLYALSGQIQEALGKRVWMKSGGYLVIEPTEALTVIDVNTGKYDKKKPCQETFRLTNWEAAAEVARQLRLRNLSGIVVVDFINMAEREEQKKLLEFLRQLSESDPVPVQVVDMTPLGLVEITRKKEEPPLAELLRADRAKRQADEGV